MKIFLIRHGEMKGDPFIEPELPVSDCLSDEMGIPQAEALKKTLREIKIDKVYSSPYGRALQTAQIALDGRDINIEILPYMYEWMPDRSLENIPSTEFEEMAKNWADRYPEETWKTDLGEGTFDMYARICPPFLKTLDSIGVHSQCGGFLIDNGLEDISIAVFAHGGSLNILLTFILGIAPFPIGKFAFQLTGVAELNFIKQKNLHYPELVIPTMS